MMSAVVMQRQFLAVFSRQFFGDSQAGVILEVSGQGFESGQSGDFKRGAGLCFIGTETMHAECGNGDSCTLVSIQRRCRIIHINMHAAELNMIYAAFAQGGNQLGSLFELAETPALNRQT